MTTMTQTIEAAMDTKGWTAAEKKDWRADFVYGTDAEIKPFHRSCPDAGRRKSLTFRLLSILPEGTMLRDEDGNEATMRKGYVYDKNGVALANYGNFLTPDMNGERFSDTVEVVK